MVYILFPHQVSIWRPQTDPWWLGLFSRRVVVATICNPTFRMRHPGAMFSHYMSLSIPLVSVVTIKTVMIEHDNASSWNIWRAQTHCFLMNLA